MKVLSIGFIGNGKSANRYHIPFLQTRKDKFAVKKIYSPNIRNRKWAALDGVIYTDRLEELLTDDGIDLVVISTPPAFHYEYAKQVILAGKNCVVEKPFMETSAQAREIFALAEEKGVMVQCYQNRRFDADFLTVQNVIKSGRLGELLELEMHFDYYRPEVPESTDHFDKMTSYLYSHACHTVDQVISFFGAPDKIHYDVRQLLGAGRMNDYFDLDLYYGALKVSVKSSYFRIKSRPSFVVYGKKGMFEQYKKDKQEEHLKKFYLPENEDFGRYDPEEYGVITYYDDSGCYHEEKVTPARGDYGCYYDALYDTLVYGREACVKAEQTILQMEILEQGIACCRP